MIGQIVSHYQILEKLGEGGMGTVFLAEDTHLSRRVAIKFPTATADEHHFRARFLREARAASKLNHPNIAAIYDYGEISEGQPFIVMELVEGHTLSELIYDGKLTLPHAVEIVRDVAQALGEAHSHDIVHRDIKPSNIIIAKRDKVKVLDFGLAKHLNGEPFQPADPSAKTLLATRTQSGAIVGTPLYLSPEQATGAPVDARSDLFALGTVLYECIAGRPAFSGNGMIEIIAEVIHVNPEPPSAFNPRVPAELDRITLKLLAKKPEARYQSTDELISDLEGALETLQERGMNQTPTRRIRPLHETDHGSALNTISDILSRPRLSVGVVLISLLFIGGVAWAVRNFTRPKRHQPSADAQKWYEIGTNDVREGTYFKALKPLEQAIAADADFTLAHARLAEAWTELDYSDRAQLEMLRVDQLVPDRSILTPEEALYLDGIRATITHDTPRAIKAYQEIARLKPKEAQAYLDLGRAYEKSDEIDKAIENYRAALDYDPQYAAAFLRLGILYGRQQDLASASAVFDKAESFFQALGNFEGLAEVLYQRGSLFNKIGKLAEANEQLQKALDITRTTDNQYQQIRALLELSHVSYAQGNTEQAKQYANQAVKSAQNSRIENLATQGLINLGDAFLVRREYVEAEQYYKQALDFAQRNKGRRNEAMALLALGKLYVQREENTDEALRIIDQALVFFQTGGYRKEASQAIILRGRAKLQKGDYDGALQDFDQQLQLAQQVNDLVQLTTSHLYIGSLLSDQELYSEALRHFDESYKISTSIGSPLNSGYSLVNRGDMLWRTGRYEEARSVLAQIPAVAERLDSKYKQVLIARSYLIEAQMALSQLRFPEAQTRAEQALNLSMAQQIRYTAVEARYTLGLAQGLAGAKPEGRRTAEEAVEMAKQESDPQLLSNALLAQAEVLFETGDPAGALTVALQAQERLARAGQKESEWRTWLIAGRASQSLNNTEDSTKYRERASTLLADLQQRWGSDVFNTYLARPDVQLYRKQLNNPSVSVR